MLIINPVAYVGIWISSSSCSCQHPWHTGQVCHSCDPHSACSSASAGIYSISAQPLGQHRICHKQLPERHHTGTLCRCLLLVGQRRWWQWWRQQGRWWQTSCWWFLYATKIFFVLWMSWCFKITLLWGRNKFVMEKAASKGKYLFNGTNLAANNTRAANAIVCLTEK